MKTTIKACLINLNQIECNIIDGLMVTFQTAVRFSFKRLLEGAVYDFQLEKRLVEKYNMTTRHAKDAIEKARQLIKSQYELVKLYYNNTKAKVDKILKSLDHETSDRKINNLNLRLDKWGRKLNVWEDHIENETIPKVIFGGRENFEKRKKV